MDNTGANWEIVAAQLPTHWRDIAEQHGWVPSSVPAQLGAKVTDVEIPVRTVLYRVATNCSLKTAAASAFAGELTDVSPVAVHLWERKLGPLFASLVADLAETEQKYAAERWAGYGIVVVDASTVSRMGACRGL